MPASGAESIAIPPGLGRHEQRIRFVWIIARFSGHAVPTAKVRRGEVRGIPQDKPAYAQVDAPPAPPLTVS
jgi:hypothetical protein